MPTGYDEAVPPSASEFNRMWLERRFEDLTQILADDIIMRGPQLVELGRGRDICVESYRKFMDSAEVLEFSQTNESANAWGDTAAVTYQWTMTYSQAGETKRDEGQELLVFTYLAGQWKLVLRVILY
jgi:ketosteroid isomerase-like protein